MNPSRLNKRISIIGQSSSQNSYGETIGAPPVIATVWANVRTLTGKALFQANQVHAEITVKAIIRYRKDIKSNMQIQFGSRTFEIISAVNMNEENRYLELSCKEMI
jgi:SPP1 family predicted phage head-tail adaptor